MLEATELFARLAAESRAIEGLGSSAEDATRLEDFVHGELTMDTVKGFCWAEAGAPLRIEPWQNVTIGERLCPTGGTAVAQALVGILEEVRAARGEPPKWETHAKFLWWHPFMDGNGRTGRAIWLWQASRNWRSWQLVEMLPLLQCLYYEALSASDRLLK